MKQVLITIDPTTGKTSIETKGYAGKACLVDTKALEDGLGITETTPTAEMYRPERVKVNR